MGKNKRENPRYVRELVIMAIILAVVALTVSYAAVNATLDIAGISAVRVATWKVEFDSASVVSKTGSAEVVYEPKISGSNVHYEVKLNEVGDSVTIKAVVKNKGNMDAKLDSYDIFGVPSEYRDNISYEVIGEDGKSLSIGTVLKGTNVQNESERDMPIYIKITYKKLIDYNNGLEKSFDLGLTLNFVQD